MNILVISSLYPNAAEPHKGIFVRQQVEALARIARVKVIAPLPWVPPLPGLGKRYAHAHLSGKETAGETEIFHPRYAVIPGIARSLYGRLYFFGIVKTASAMRKDFDFDVVLAYYAYPDGYGASLLASLHKKPLCIVALGSDIKVFTKGFLRRRLTARALRRAHAVVAVSHDLAERMADLGVSREKITPLINGVDTSLFYPRDMREARRQLDLPQDERIVLFVGNLEHVKGIMYLLEAAVALRETEKDSFLLALVGEGTARGEIESFIDKHGLQNHIKLFGRRTHREIPLWMNSCDIFCLPSISEGCPNVVLEALACARPVVASAVGGIPELIESDKNGCLVPAGDAPALTRALQHTLEKQWDSVFLNRGAARFTWKENARILYTILQGITTGGRP